MGVNDIRTDLLIIGTGIAGCSFALEAQKLGLDVVMVSRANDPIDSNTYRAQGGIIYQNPKESEQHLYDDVLRCGANINRQESVKLVATHGPELVKSILIDQLSINFEKKSNDEYALTSEGAHSLPRVLYVADHTGRTIQERFIEVLRDKPRIRIIPHTTAVDLLTFSHHSTHYPDIYRQPTCIGGLFFDQLLKVVYPIFSKITVIATGGVGRLFLHTTNPPGARGDGIAMAFRAGVRIINLEYIQFHPTTLFVKDQERFLISEALRGSGARLLNNHGKPFMRKYHPKGELASRDIVSRSIHTEMLTTGAECVYLDISFKDAGWTRSRFPTIYERCLSLGIDITQSPIPVVPAAHYSCGGVYTDIHGQTTMANLFAVGEAACTGLHGANRLASISLLEGLVMGTIGARHAKTVLSESLEFPKIREWQYGRESIDPALIHQDWLTIKHTMWNYVGLVRSQKRLDRARDIIHELHREIDRFYASAVLDDQIVGLRNAALTALLITNAATQNKESLGCHYRED